MPLPGLPASGQPRPPGSKAASVRGQSVTVTTARGNMMVPRRMRMGMAANPLAARQDSLPSQQRGAHIRSGCSGRSRTSELSCLAGSIRSGPCLRGWHATVKPRSQPTLLWLSNWWMNSRRSRCCPRAAAAAARATGCSQSAEKYCTGARRRAALECSGCQCSPAQHATSGRRCQHAPRAAVATPRCQVASGLTRCYSTCTPS